MKPLLIVVDDDTDDIELVQDALLQIPNAPELKYFLNAEELLKFFKDKFAAVLPPLVITLDINLPGINGIDLLILLKKDCQFENVPISMITTSNSVTQKALCLKHGASHFFTKPIKLNDWKKIMNSILEDINYSN